MKPVSARIIELKPGESVSVDENEAIVIVPRGNKSVLEGVDPVFWDIERDAIKKTAFLDRELKKHAIAWRFNQFIIEKFPDGCILYVMTSKGRLFLLPDYNWTLQAVIYPDELQAYAHAKRYTEFGNFTDIERIAALLSEKGN